MRNDGEASGGGQKGGGGRFEYVTRGIAGKYPKIFAKESNEIFYPDGFPFALLGIPGFHASVFEIFLFGSDFWLWHNESVGKIRTKLSLRTNAMQTKMYC
jgi:hypothetical protein